MNEKFLILLFVTIFYNGVIYASPVNEHNEEVIPFKEQPSTASPVTTDHIKKKIEPTPAPIVVEPIPVTQKSSAPLKNTETPPIKIATAHPDANIKSTPEAPHEIDSKNASSVIDNKNPSFVTDGKNTSQPIDNKSMVPTHATKNATVPTEVLSGMNNSVLPFTHPPQNPTVIPAITSTLKMNTLNKADITTNAPNSINSDKVVVVHNVPTPVQEKHFDGPSFIGGIVLTIGLTAIGFIAFKYYKSGKIDMNYRTL